MELCGGTVRCLKVTTVSMANLPSYGRSDFQYIAWLDVSVHNVMLPQVFHSSGCKTKKDMEDVAINADVRNNAQEIDQYTAVIFHRQSSITFNN